MFNLEYKHSGSEVIKLFFQHFRFMSSCFISFDPLHHSQQYFGHVGMGLPGLKQY